MSDLFHEEMPLDYLQRIFEVMAACPHHIFQMLTKRHERLVEWAPLLSWPANVWMGVSVETQAYVHRIDCLRKVPAKIRFLSCEPLLGPLDLNLEGIQWVITGGESGLKFRPVAQQWVTDIRDQCLTAGVAFFHKQWGGKTPKAQGRKLEGRTWDQMPQTT
jgi:protein gp37